jgi:hypothetical protein
MMNTTSAMMARMIKMVHNMARAFLVSVLAS